MKTTKRRLAGLATGILALSVAGAGIVAAHDQGMGMGPDGGRGFGPGQAEMHGGRGGRGMGPGGFGIGEALRDQLGAELGTFVRTESLFLAEDGTLTIARQERGTVTAVADGTLTYTLASGESVTVTTDAATETIAFSAERPYRDPVETAVVAVGDVVLVGSTSTADGSFLAHHVRILPPVPATETAPAEVPTETAAPANG